MCPSGIPLQSLQFKILIICVVLLAVAQGQSFRKCGEFNEYCQNHWDCCSNSCLTYLYRCTRPHPIFPYAFFGHDYPVAGTLNDIMDNNFGRAPVPPNNYYQRPQPHFTPLGLSSRFGDVGAEQTASPATTQATSVNNGIGNAATPCKAIGEKCYRNEECCTQRCHHYLVQCVT